MLQVWPGNDDGTSIKRVVFDTNIRTRYLRIYPQEFKYYRCLRVEVYGCRHSENGRSTSVSGRALDAYPRLKILVSSCKILHDHGKILPRHLSWQDLRKILARLSNLAFRAQILARFFKILAKILPRLFAVFPCLIVPRSCHNLA